MFRWFADMSRNMECRLLFLPLILRTVTESQETNCTHPQIAPRIIMKLESLRDLLVEQLQDLYDAEYRITKALPKMAKAASSPELKAAFEKHLAETEGHVTRLEQAFEALGERAKKKPCQAIKGLIEEGQETIKQLAEPEVKDAALIAAAQRVEHYEMAGYGTVCTFAKLLKEKEAYRLLKQTMAEEVATDKALTQLAESTVNLQAV
jgi:ferritin-like metal-binding protein YciE